MKSGIYIILVGLFIMFCGCSPSGGGSGGDPSATQLATLINQYRMSLNPPKTPWQYDSELAAVAQAYAQWLDQKPPEHQYPYSEAADGKGLSGRLADAGINASVSAEAGCSSTSITNAQLFFNSIVSTGILDRDDVDRMGVGHVSPPRGYTYYHYWILDVIKKATP